MRWRLGYGLGVVTIAGVLALAGEGVRAAEGQAARLYVFNVGSKDITVIDPETHTVLETRSLGASIRWLSNEQDFFDGRYLWTYEANAQASVLVIDPRSWTVVRRIQVGRGPAHSVILTPDRRLALVDVAGDDRIAVIDTATYQVTRTIPMGKFPCDSTSPQTGDSPSFLSGTRTLLPSWISRPGRSPAGPRSPLAVDLTCSASPPTAERCGSRLPPVRRMMCSTRQRSAP